MQNMYNSKRKKYVISSYHGVHLDRYTLNNTNSCGVQISRIML